MYLPALCVNATFQFYNSSIKTLWIEKCSTIQTSFNSIIVRLRRRLPQADQHIFSVFQFYNSSIKTLVGLGYGLHELASFNSIIVRLRHQLSFVPILVLSCFNSIIVRLRRFEVIQCFPGCCVSIL